MTLLVLLLLSANPGAVIEYSADGEWWYQHGPVRLGHVRARVDDRAETVWLLPVRSPYLHAGPGWFVIGSEPDSAP